MPDSEISAQAVVIEQLAARGDREALERMRGELVERLHWRAGDSEATAALTLVNRALAQLGWENPYDWRRRRKP